MKAHFNYMEEEYQQHIRALEEENHALKKKKDIKNQKE